MIAHRITQIMNVVRPKSVKFLPPRCGGKQVELQVVYSGHHGAWDPWQEPSPAITKGPPTANGCFELDLRKSAALVSEG